MRCGSKSVGWIGCVVWLAACSADVAGPNRAPVADAGPDQVVVLDDGGAVALLDGSGSYDPDGDAINLGWTLLSRPAGSAAALSADDGEQVELQIDLAGSYVVGLVASDGRLASERDVVRLRTAGEPCVDDGDCDDGLWCNGAEVCDPVEGCQAGATPECDDGVACTIDACDEEADACTHQPDAAACDDGFWCNGAEVCDAVQGCQPGTAPDCNDGVACTQDSCDEQADACVNAPDDAVCDDSLWCNGPEVCHPEAGCQRQAAPDCDDGIACTVDSCDEETDMCLHAPDDAACNDGNDCTVDTCLADSGCEHVAGNEGQVCDQGNCNGTCSGGLCVPCACDDDADCDDGFACTTDSCDNGVCVYQTDDAVCDDGQWCNGAERCVVDQGCQPGQPPDCDDGVGCTDDSCDEDADQCSNVVDHANCDDGDWCDGAEVCDAVQDCQPGQPPDCDDGVGCTDDSCDEDADRCVNTPVDANCDDGDWCNGAEVCDAVQDCQPGQPPDCDDGVGCTDDSCDEDVDQCSNVVNHASCDDGQWCNGAEVCDAVQGCLPGAPPCDDGVGCTTDTCDEGNESCTNTPDDDACDDGVFCNGAETCDPVSDCQAGSDPCPEQPYCDETHHCMECLPDQPYCDADGQTLHVCQSDGSGPEPGQDVLCGYICEAGACIAASNVTEEEMTTCDETAPVLAPQSGSLTFTDSGIECSAGCSEEGDVLISSNDGPTAADPVRVCVSSLDLPAGIDLLPDGSEDRGLVLIVDGDASIAGQILFDGGAGSDGEGSALAGGTAGPGGFPGADGCSGHQCTGLDGPGPGGGSGGTRNGDQAGAGGGAGHAGLGGDGGDGLNGAGFFGDDGGAGGSTYPAEGPWLEPLVGGSGGASGADGSGGYGSGPGGGGGGALQITVRGSLTVGGTLGASGGRGGEPDGNHGAGGGGAGGGILLEARTLGVSGSLLVEGGRGGDNASCNSFGGAGASGGVLDGDAGDDGSGCGGSGGGGGGGRIRLRSLSGADCAMGTISPAASCTAESL